MNPQPFRVLSRLLLTALAVGSAGRAGAAAPEADGAKPADRQVKVVVARGDGEPTEMVFTSEDGEAEGVHAVFVGADGQVQTLPAGGPGEPHAFAWKMIDSEPRGYLGVELTDLTPELRAHFGAPEEAGVLVARVEPDSPAAAAGLQVGDVVTALDGERVATSRDLRRRVRGLDDGEALAIEVRRDGRVVDLTADVVRRQVPEVDARRFLWRTEDGEGFNYEVDPEAMSAEVKRLSEHLAGPEFQGRVQHLQVLEGDLGKRLDELEAKLADLERQLAESKAQSPAKTTPK